VNKPSKKKPISDTSSLPAVKIEPPKKPKIVIEVPLIVEVKNPKSETITLPEQTTYIKTPVSSPNSNKIEDNQTKNPKADTSELNSNRQDLKNLISDTNVCTTVADNNSLKTTPKKPDVNEAASNVELSNAEKVEDPNAAPDKTATKFYLNKKLILVIALLIIAALIGSYIYRKSFKRQALPLNDDSSSENLKLMASYNGVEYDLGDFETIGSLDIGSHPGSIILIECGDENQRLFTLKSKKDKFFIKNLSGKIININSIPLAPKRNTRVFLPCEITYGDNVSIQFYQNFNEDNNNSNQ
jgi:hypothetical protein